MYSVHGSFAFAPNIHRHPSILLTTESNRLRSDRCHALYRLLGRTCPLEGIQAPCYVDVERNAIIRIGYHHLILETELVRVNCVNKGYIKGIPIDHN